MCRHFVAGLTGWKAGHSAVTATSISPVLRGVVSTIEYGSNSNIVTPQRGNSWQQINTNLNLNSKGYFLLARSDSLNSGQVSDQKIWVF